VAVAGRQGRITEAQMNATTTIRADTGRPAVKPALIAASGEIDARPMLARKAAKVVAGHAHREGGEGGDGHRGPYLEGGVEETRAEAAVVVAEAAYGGRGVGDKRSAPDRRREQAFGGEHAGQVGRSRPGRLSQNRPPAVTRVPAMNHVPRTYRADPDGSQTGGGEDSDGQRKKCQPAVERTVAEAGTSATWRASTPVSLFSPSIV
jgi:hypothetical protein